MKTLQQIFISIALLFFFGCSFSTNTPTDTAATADSAISVTDEFGGPPFNDTCICNFKEFGRYKISNDNFNIYLCGKGWNPDFQSCSWTWGEIINNEMPDDTNITVVKVHLLDLENFTLPTSLTEFGNDTLKQYAIAAFTYDKKSGKAHCEFDPYKTGKYPKPKQWVED